MSVVQTLAHAAQPWQSAYNNSKAIATTVIFLHLGAMLFGGGTAIAADRTVLRAADDDEKRAALSSVSRTHSIVVAALALSLLSGFLLAASDVKTFATSPVFWTKMTLVVLLLLNGAALWKIEQTALGDPPAFARSWSRLRITAILSILLWTCVLLAGTILVNAT